jgi:hypothetical protein
MDRVRFGRALGYGARHAAKAMVSAVDAATTPSPAAASKPTVAVPAGRSAVTGAVEAVEQVARAHAVAKQQSAVLKKSMLAPVKKFSSVIWLQVTGAFFGLFAVTMGGAVWHHRADFRLGIGSPEAWKAGGYVALFLVFAWFTVSNFMRASRRDKQQ